jgi:hypothetical protein
MAVRAAPERQFCRVGEPVRLPGAAGGLPAVTEHPISACRRSGYRDSGNHGRLASGGIAGQCDIDDWPDVIRQRGPFPAAIATALQARARAACSTRTGPRSGPGGYPRCGWSIGNGGNASVSRLDIAARELEGYLQRPVHAKRTLLTLEAAA